MRIVDESFTHAVLVVSVCETNNNRVSTVRWNLKSLRWIISPKQYVNRWWHLVMTIRPENEEVQCRLRVSRYTLVKTWENGFAYVGLLSVIMVGMIRIVFIIDQRSLWYGLYRNL